MVGPLAEGLNFDVNPESRPVNEMLADRFAAEVLCPLPVIAHHACNTPLARWPSELVPIEQAVRVTRRPMFVVKLDPIYDGRDIVSSARQVICRLWDVFQLSSESLEILGSVAIHSDSYRTRYVHRESTKDVVGWFLSRDGLAYRLEGHELLLEAWEASGVFEHLNGPTGQSSYARKRIPLRLLHGFIPIGGHWFIVRSFLESPHLEDIARESTERIVVGIQDKDGFLEQAFGGSSFRGFSFNGGESLPLLPAGTPGIQATCVL